MRSLLHKGGKNMNGSKDIAIASIKMAMTSSREDEKALLKELSNKGIKVAAIDYGGEFSSAVPKIIERAVVAARRENIIGDSHAEEGAVAGAAHDAIAQIYNKAIGLNLGGKIGIARSEGHLAVCVFFAVGLLNLNDVAMGLSHRAI